MYDTIIIGAGPAGLTAAIYLRRANKKVLVFDSNSYGGQIINASDIENYPGYAHISGFDLATNFYNQVKTLKAEVNFEKVIEIKPDKIKKVITTKKEYLTKSIIIATGCETKKLGLANENELLGKGISYCATCDGNFYKGKTVAVVGGGNTAIEDALYLADIAKKVYLIHRREEFRADAKTIMLLKKKNNIKYVLKSNITKINGQDYLESIEVASDKKIMVFNIDGLFIAIGHNPNNALFKEMLKLDSNGYIIGDNNLHTSKRGIFVAGDVRSKRVRQLVTATSDGAIAATEAIKYLDK